MAKPDILIVDGHAFSWQRLCELRKQQLEAWRLSQPQQPTLFTLREDHRPVGKRNAAQRYLEPNLFTVLEAPR
jgi:hypothetical protein